MINGYNRDNTPFPESVLDQSPVHGCLIIIGFLTFYSKQKIFQAPYNITECGHAAYQNQLKRRKPLK